MSLQQIRHAICNSRNEDKAMKRRHCLTLEDKNIRSDARINDLDPCIIPDILLNPDLAQLLTTSSQKDWNDI